MQYWHYHTPRLEGEDDTTAFCLPKVSLLVKEKFKCLDKKIPNLFKLFKYSLHPLVFLNPKKWMWAYFQVDMA